MHFSLVITPLTVPTMTAAPSLPKLAVFEIGISADFKICKDSLSYVSADPSVICECLLRG
jgi:hypothetical protein